MSPRIESGQLVTVAPATAGSVLVGDVVLCRVGGAQYLHLVRAVQGGRMLIGNMRGGTNGWASAVYGRMTRVKP